MTEIIRAEVVGSMLRPPELLQAREQVMAGAIGRGEFKRIEDRAIDDAIALHERADVEVVTDGELRRLSFVGPLTDTVDGVRPIDGAEVHWHDEEGDKPHLQPAIVQRLTPRRSLARRRSRWPRWAARTSRSTPPSSRRSSTPRSATSTRRSASRPSACSARASSCSTRWSRAWTRSSACIYAAATTRASG